MHRDELDVVSPASGLRLKLVQGRSRWLCLGALVAIWLIDSSLSNVLLRSDIIGDRMQDFDLLFEEFSGYLFFVVTSVMAFAVLRPLPRLVIPMASIYSAFAVAQLIANVLSMVLTAHVKTGIGLTELWDVAAVYVMSVVVFMVVYLLFDVTTPGGAFVWPSREGQEPPEPHLIDYLFVSLNVNSTYGPTSEAVMSRGCKLVMALQTLLSVLMLTVLIARAVGAAT
jgi:hypothetical protein